MEQWFVKQALAFEVKPDTPFLQSSMVPLESHAFWDIYDQI